MMIKSSLGCSFIMEREVNKMDITMLEGTEVVEFDELLAQDNLNDPNKDWSNKIADGIGDDK